MVNLIGKRTLQLLAGGALMLFASVSYAQYVWVDANGTKQFSDRPPPPGIPAKNIIKQPGGTPAKTDGATAPAASAPAPAVEDKTSMTLAEREAEYRKRAKAKEEEAKKASQANAARNTNKAACEGARTYKRTLEQGMRVTTTDKNGERAVMDDAQRAAEMARANKTIAEACK
jgi:hypothetical protein